jgi:hypothetical protein
MERAKEGESKGVKELKGNKFRNLERERARE